MWPFNRRPKQEDTRDVDVGGSDGFGAQYGVHYTRHAQPDPGIAAYSYDTLALPLYTAIGGGIQNQRQFASAPSNIVVVQHQAIGITTIGNPGNLAGTFTSGPLLDTSSEAGDAGASAIPRPGEFELRRGMV